MFARPDSRHACDQGQADLSYKLPVMSCELPVMSCELPVMSCELPVMNCGF